VPISWNNVERIAKASLIAALGYDDDDAVRPMISLTPEHTDFELVAAANVTEARKLTTSER
jgi:hypothetical protein